MNRTSKNKPLEPPLQAIHNLLKPHLKKHPHLNPNTTDPDTLTIVNTNTWTWTDIEIINDTIHTHTFRAYPHPPNNTIPLADPQLTQKLTQIINQLANTHTK